MLVWTEEEFGTGVPRIDEAHRELFARINALDEATLRGRAKAEIWRLLDFLEEYARSHFSCEEAVMSKHKCASCAANKQEHGRFLEELADLRTLFDREGATDAFRERLETKVVGWIQTHIRRIDSKLRDVVVETA